MPAAEAAPDNMNGWVEEEDPEMEEEEEDPKEDLEMEEEEEEMDADEEWDGPEWILPDQGADPLYPPPPASDSESEIEFKEAEAEAEAEAEVAPIPPPVPANPEPEAVTVGAGRLTPLKRLFTDTQVWIGSSSSSTAASHDPEDLTPSHIRSDLDALHCRVQQSENDDIRAENKRMGMMLDCSENHTRAAWRELDRTTWHYYHLRHWSIVVENLLPPRLQYQEPPYALPEALLAPVTHNDPRDPYVAAQGSPPRDSLVNAAVEAERARQCNPTVFHGYEGAVELSRWFEKTEMVFRISKCAEARKVKFTAATLQGRALTWWNSQVATRGLEVANQIGWTEMKRLRILTYHELVYYRPDWSRLLRNDRKLKIYIRGLTDNIKGTVIGSKPTSLNEVVRMAHTLMKQKAQARTERIAEGNKIKWESSQGGNNVNNRNNNRDNTHHNQQNNQRQGNARAMTTAPAEQGGYAGNKPLCNRCRKHHFGYCKVVCNNCGKAGHMARDCKGKAIATGANARPTVTCYDCGEKGHTRNYCPKRKDPQGEEARGRAYVIKDTEKQQGPNVVTGTFLLNNRYATVLFDSGSDKSFVNTSFSHLIDINPVRLDTSYEVELADGRVASTNIVLRGCTLNLLNHLFKIDLMPIELGTFDIVIGMDWLVDQDTVIVCGKKVVHIPVKDKTLVVKGGCGTS
ncbi:putative reverse transcriptase domain-containing protein [Tanacetum coccineum]